MGEREFSRSDWIEIYSVKMRAESFVKKLYRNSPGQAPARTRQRFSMSRRAGFSLVELVCVIGVLFILVTLMVPSMQYTREAARRTQCRDNLRQIGRAMCAYEYLFERYPSGLTFDPASKVAYANTFAILLPYFAPDSGLEHIATGYDPAKPWSQQLPEIAAAKIPVLSCPSSPLPNRATDIGVSRLKLPSGALYGETDYILSVGATDALCLPYENVSIKERGLFGLNSVVRRSDIVDGISLSLALGEGASGPNWMLDTSHSLAQPCGADGSPLTAVNPWIVGGFRREELEPLGIVTSSVFGSTVNPMNRSPITDTRGLANDLSDCRSSTNGGTGRIGNFRGDHPGGLLFLFADGWVRFVSDKVDHATFKRMSSVGSGDVDSRLPD